MTAWLNVNMDIKPITLETQAKEPRKHSKCLLRLTECGSGTNIQCTTDEGLKYLWTNSYGSANSICFRFEKGIIENWMKTIWNDTHVSHGSCGLYDEK